MANKRISSLTSLGATPAVGDILPITDVSDTTGSAQGTTKKVTVANLVAAAPQGDLLASNNLSDVANAGTSRTNLGLGTAATSASTDFSPAFFTTVSDTTTARTLSDSDNGKVIVFSNSSAVTVTVPGGLTSGFGCTMVQGGNGKVTVISSGSATVNAHSAGSGALNTTASQHAAIQLIPTGTNAYTISGDSGLPPFLNVYSLSFDGTNDNLTPNTQINISGAKSLTMWFKADDLTNRSLIGGTPGFGYWFQLSSSTSLNTVNGQVVNYTAWNTSDWFHLAATSSGSGSNLHIYVNGSAVNTSLTDFDFSFNRIGSTNSNGNFFDGLIDEIGVWNAQLSAAEITEIYGSSGNREFDLTTNSGNYSSSGALQHYYRMGDNDSGSSSTVTDNAGSNDLTVNGATSSTTVPS